MQLLFSGHVDEWLATVGAVLKALGLKLATTPRRAMISYLICQARLRLRGFEFHEREERHVPEIVFRKIDICWSMAIGLSSIDTIRGADFQAHNLLLSLSAGEPVRIARALATEAGFTSIGGSFASKRSRKLLRIADGLAQRLDQPYTSAIVDLMSGIAAYMEGGWSTGLASCDRAETIFRESCAGTAWMEINLARTISLWSLHFRGRVTELSRRWEFQFREAKERGDLFSVTNLSSYIMAIVKLAADEPGYAQEGLSTAMDRWSQQGFHVQHFNALIAQLFISLYRGDGPSAWAHISERWPFYRKSLLPRIQITRIMALQVRGDRAHCGDDHPEGGAPVAQCGEGRTPAYTRKSHIGVGPCGSHPRRNRRRPGRPVQRRGSTD